MEEEFNSLRDRFGPKGRANQLTFAQFVALPDDEVNDLLKRVEDYVDKGRLAEMRAQARSLSVSSQGNS